MKASGKGEKAEMKNTKVRLAPLCVLLMAVLFAVPTLAQDEPQGIPRDMPQDMLAYILKTYQKPQFEDYLALPGLPDGDYGFALVRYHGVRVLLGFRWQGDVMEIWLDSMGAVPQTDRKAEFYHYAAGTEINYIWDEKNEYSYVTQGFNVGVSIPDRWNETIESDVYYEWEGGTFHLRRYRNNFWDADVLGDTFYFWDIGNGLRNVVDSDVSRNWRIQDVSFECLPKRADEISQRADDPPEIPKTYEPDALFAETYRFAPDKKYPVYNGPGRQYQRAGSGKASVSTNSWIQVFGEYDGWLLIQYALSDMRCRIGWITRDALPKDRFVERLAFAQGDEYTLEEPWTLTDDPLCSHAMLCEVPAGTCVTGMKLLGYAWMYVRVEVDGQTWWGFLPKELLKQE